MSTLASATNLSFPISQKSPSSMFWSYRAFVMNWHFPLEKGLLRLLWNPVSLYKAAKNLAIDVRRFKFHFIPTADYQKCSCWSNQGKLFHQLSRSCYLKGLRFQRSALRVCGVRSGSRFDQAQGFGQEPPDPVGLLWQQGHCKVKVMWVTTSGLRTRT